MELISLYLLFAMLATMWFDVTRYTIPNWLIGSLLILYPVAVYLSPHQVDWRMALVAMAVVFVAGYIIFATKIMGGGDVKLITVLALWVGWVGLLDYVIIFALLGGIFTIFLLIMRKLWVIIPMKAPRIFQNKAPVPYGVAIAGAFLYFMYVGRIPVLPYQSILHQIV